MTTDSKTVSNEMVIPNANDSHLDLVCVAWRIRYRPAQKSTPPIRQSLSQTILY